MGVSQEDWLEVSQADLDIMLEDYRRAEVSKRGGRGFGNYLSGSSISCKPKSGFSEPLSGERLHATRELLCLQ